MARLEMTQRLFQLIVGIAFVLVTSPMLAQAEQGTGNAEDLAKKLANPVASLISVPLQNNFDFGGGFNDEAFRYTLNVQPVIPIALNNDWNLISRTILPVIYQRDVTAKDDEQSGLGDTVQSFFLSPAASDPIWGVGPVFVLPTGTDEALGTEKWGAGVTGVFLKQAGPWTYGTLANHIWSFAGNENRSDVSATFLQPFMSYTTKQAWTYTLNIESTLNWEANNDKWTVPVNAQATKVLKWGGQLVSVGGGARLLCGRPGYSTGLGSAFHPRLSIPKISGNLGS